MGKVGVGMGIGCVEKTYYSRKKISPAGIFLLMAESKENVFKNNE